MLLFWNCKHLNVIPNDFLPFGDKSDISDTSALASLVGCVYFNSCQFSK